MLLDFEQIKSATHGAVRIMQIDGYTAFDRFSEEQRGLFGPGYSEDSMSSASVVIDFKTDASIISFEWKCLKGLVGGSFYSDVCIDGLYAANFGMSGINASIGEGDFVLGLPEGIHRVQIYLCHMCRVRLKNIKLENAGVFKPSVPKHTMLCLGDSITQGHGVQHPSMTYVNRLADSLCASAVNKGVGGMCFRSDLLYECKNEAAEIVTLAYGTNDWCSVSREALLSEISKIVNILNEYYSESKVYVITPFWRTDINAPAPLCIDRPAPCGDFYGMIKDIKSAFSGFNVIDGLEVFPHVPDYFSDLWLHPGDFGSVLLADGIRRRIDLD